MRYVIQFFALLVAFPLLLRYCNAHPAKFSGPPPSLFKAWSRSGRLTFVWVSVILTVVVAIPACLTVAFVLPDADTCTGVTNATRACHSPIRYAIAAGLVVLIFVGALKWSALLQRIYIYKESESFE
jgi:hypothetical protein